MSKLAVVEVRGRKTDSGRRPSPCTLVAGSLILSFFLSFSWNTPGFAADGPEPSKRRPLDLPSGGPGVSDDEEDAPETIAFYGSIYEGDAFFWCLDHSGSMAVAGQWDVLRAEVESAIAELSDEAEFGLVAYSSGTSIWKQVPARATTAAKNSAVAWLADLEPQGSTCLLPAALKLLQLAQSSERASPVGFIVSDGLPYCGGIDTSDACLVDIPAANVPQIPVHTVYVAADAPGSNFLRALARACGGSFILVSP